MAHTWKLPYGGGSVSDINYSMYYRGQRIKEAWYRGEKVWGDDKPASFGEVIFWDWTGKKLLTVTATDLLKMNAFPDIHPDGSWPEERFDSRKEWWLHQGLSADGWTYTLEQAKEHVSKVGYLDIAAVYSTPNNGADIVYWIDASDGKQVKLNGSVSGAIDWGDGNVNSSATHIYGSAGNYRIVISPANTVVMGHLSFSAQNAYAGRANIWFNGGAFGYDFPYVVVATSTGQITYGSIEANSNPDPAYIKPVAIYTGNMAQYRFFSFYGSAIECVGMVRDHDPFTLQQGGWTSRMALQDGAFENCNQCHTFTVAPGCNSLPLAISDGSNVYHSIYELATDQFPYAITGGQRYYTPFVVSSAMLMNSLKHMFLPYGWTGKKTLSPTGNRFTLMTGMNALNNEIGERPFGLCYPVTTERLIEVTNYGNVDRYVIASDSLDAVPNSHTLTNSEGKYMVPTGRAEYYASVLPNGSQLLAEGRIVESTPLS